MIHKLREGTGSNTGSFDFRHAWRESGNHARRRMKGASHRRLFPTRCLYEPAYSRHIKVGININAIVLRLIQP
jgi:hypothetical protein